MRVDDVSLDPRTQKIAWQLPSKQEQKTEKVRFKALFLSLALGRVWMQPLVLQPWLLAEEFGMLPHVSTVGRRTGNSPGEPDYWQATSTGTLTQK